MKMPRGSKTTDKSALAHRDALECLPNRKLGLAAQLADLGWTDIREKADALEWYAKKWRVNISELNLYKLLGAAWDKDSSFNKRWIARRQKYKMRSRAKV